MNTLENIKTKIAEISEKKQELLSILRKDFAPTLKPLFEKSNGKIKSFGWSQYTPYFNDGDECVFSVNVNVDYEVYINGVSIDDHEDLFGSSMYALKKWGTPDYEKWIECYPEDKINEETKESDLQLYGVLKEFTSLILSIDGEFLKDLFGDHVLVTVHCDGSVETEDYNHD